MAAHIYDLCLTPEALQYAARWVARRSIDAETGVSLWRNREHVFVAVDRSMTSGWYDMKEAPDDGTSEQRVRLTRGTICAAAEWVTAGETMGAVSLLVDDRMLLVYQGDDRVGFDTDGSPASEEYLALAPLDR